MNARVLAPAKINLTLQVGRPRADGRHDISSIVAFADFGDAVEAAPSEDLSLQVTGPFAAALADEKDNLVLRAAHRLAEAAGLREPGAHLMLDKHLPIASGIGGGSSDAAATLKALNQLWRIGALPEDLADLARPLGADLPVCLGARAALMSGVGEILAPIDLPVLDAVLVNPRAPLSTAAVYRQFDRMALGADVAPQAAPRWRDSAAAIAGLAQFGNDLAAPARALMPAIAEIEAMLAADARALLVRLSGSGATLFALTESAEDAALLAASVLAQKPHWWVRAVKLNAA
jgi:4-diphosphocytidyl-2-C-methyl-D-erythritol kinase